ncbi:hypothetical protein N7527_010914 [Penicillium freii]|nr:hypothetical protein N7527_010914 [Penicillium freii]
MGSNSKSLAPEHLGGGILCNFDRWVTKDPTKCAIVSEDEQLTYSELDCRSRQLASNLTQHGVGLEDVVAFCFPKSVHAVIAILGILRCGAAFTALPPDAPKVRKKEILTVCKPKVVLCGEEQEGILDGLYVPIVPVGDDTYRQREPAVAFPSVSNNNAACVLFTSGSTGKQKGVVYEHGNILVASETWGAYLGIGPRSRVLQWCSFTFDVSIVETIVTLILGGCICMPTDEQRMQGTEAFVNRVNADWAFFTPSVARTLDPTCMPGLKTVVLGGEATSKEIVARWAPNRRLVNSYGPCECTVYFSFAELRDEGVDVRNVGVPCFNGYIVSPDDVNILIDGEAGTGAPATGELLIQGPTVVRGYLHDDRSAAFVCPPAWYDGVLGPDARFYLTGDIVERCEDGSIRILGRKDRQVKIRGQKVDLDEIRHHFLSSIPDLQDFVALFEGFSKTQQHRRHELVAFVVPHSMGRRVTATITPMTEGLLADLVHACEALQEIVARYMLPTLFIPLTAIPLTAHSKLDLATLRTFLASLDTAQERRFALHECEFQPLVTEDELILGDILAVQLGLAISDINSNMGFVQLGGDSIKAMSVAKELARRGKYLPAQTALLSPTIKDMAQAITPAVAASSPEVPAPFSLLSAGSTRMVRQQAAKACGVPEEGVRDAFPCTALQEGFLAVSSRDSRANVARYVFKMGQGADAHALSASWLATVSAIETLRTRFFLSPTEGLVQVIVDDGDRNLPCFENLADLLQFHNSKHFGLGGPMVRAGLVTNPQLFVLSMHHAVFDLFTLRLVLNTLKAAYTRQPLPPVLPFTIALDERRDTTSVEASEAFWKSTLEHSSVSNWPLPGPTSSLATEIEWAYCFRNLDIPSPAAREKSNTTVATYLQAAWALLLSAYQGSDDVVYAMAVSGRESDRCDALQIAGPMLATCPLRLRTSQAETVGGLLASVQRTVLEATSHAHLGVQRIARLGEDERRACTFQTILVVQPDLISTELLQDIDLHLDTELTQEEALASYACWVECIPSGGQLTLKMEYLPQAAGVDGPNVLRCLEHIFCVLIQALPEDTISTLALFPPQGLGVAHPRHEAAVSEVCQQTVHEYILNANQKYPNKQAVVGWNGEITYRELDQLSERLALRLRRLGLGIGDVVPFHTHKSIWTVVGLLAVLRVGGTIMFLDMNNPTSRNREILNQLRPYPTLMVCSPGTEQFWSADVKCTVELGADLKSDTSCALGDSLPQVPPETVAYLFFTSGTSGTPKGIEVEHRAYLTAALARLGPLERTLRSRVLQVTPFSFDVSIDDMWTTLLAGGTIIMPSEAERLNDLAGAIARYAATDVSLTPTVATLLRPDQVPSLEVLVLAGEAPNEALYNTWLSTPVHLYNAYGPTECSILTTSTRAVAGDPRNIGHVTCGRAWVTHPENPHVRMPLGAVGELLIEGPGLARGYYRNEPATLQSFVVNLPWATPGRRFYRTGDLVRANLDGSFTYLRRRDQQIKLRGVRIEVAEIEAKLLSAGAGVVHEACVDIVKLQGKEVLVSLCTVRGDSAQSLQTRWHVLIAPALQILRARLPRYMMPTLFIPLPALPATVTGKRDRQKLRSIVCNIPADELRSYTASHISRQASSHNQKSDPDWELATPELTLAQALWIEALGLGADSKIQMNPLSNFFDHGGDSVVAMRLVALCRSRCRRQIGVADIYKRPTLMDLAFALRESTDTVSRKPSSPATAPFSMLGPWRQHNAVLAAIHKQLADVEIEDVYPCTAFQEGVMALSTQQQGSYVAKYQFALASADLDAGRLRHSLRQVVAANPILRTRIIYVDGFGYFQAVLAASDLMDPLTEAHGVIVRPWEQGSPLVQFSLAATGPQPELWSYASHAVFDAITWDLFLAQLNAAYRSKLQPNMIVPYAVFVHARARAGQEDDAEFHDFWIQTLGDAEHTRVFPDSRQDRVEATQFFEVDMDMDVGNASRGTSDATQLHAAWALTLSAFSTSEDVVFGSVMSERFLGIQDGDRIMGPCIATVPVRSRLDQVRGCDLHTWLCGEQRHLMQVLSHAQIGPAQIERLAPRALQFDTVIQIIAPLSEQRDDDLVRLVASGPAYDNSAGYFTSPLVLEMKPSKGKLSIEAIFNATVVPPHLVSNMVHTLFHITKQLRSAGTGATLADIKIYSPYHRDQIATWNSFAPPHAQSTAPQLISHWAQSAPTKIAIEAWDGVLTYSEIVKYASALALYIQSNFVLSPAEETIAICFSRSRWVPVVMLAVQQLKRAYLALEPSHPTQRLLQLVQQAGAKLILADAKQSDRFASLSEVLTVDRQLQDRLLAVHEDTRSADIANVQPSDPAVVVYTSGSTGLPKAILLEQRALSSAIGFYGLRMDFGPTTRTLQNAAFAFDIHACETFFTLVHGGCLVIADAGNDLAHLGATIREHDINWLFMTPSTMHLLPHPDKIPSVKTLMMIGEAPTRSVVEKWVDPTKIHLINAYGPAENTLFSTMYSFRAKHEDPTTIGLPVGCTAWVVSPHDINVLLPVGCAGELLLQGPQLAREYLSQPDETARRFVRAPRWTTDFDVDGGNDVRFYKTGDMVRQEADGMLHFIGRMDSQAKLNGQRFELAEVEHYISFFLHGVRVVAEIIEPQGGAPTLAVFIEDLDRSVILSKEDLTSKLHACLPSFMVPSLFVRVHELPQTSSKKLDRKALKAMGSSQTFQELKAMAPAFANAQPPSITTVMKSQPRTPTERVLQRLWKNVLALPKSDIGVDENFFELGGNSIQAIRLATLISAECRQPIRIPTSAIFQNPHLKDMAVLLESQGLQCSISCPTVAAATISPDLLDYCATSLAIPQASIQDIYPCTPLQERMLAASAVSPNAYVAEHVWAVPLDINVKRFKDAWRQTIDAFDILRTEFVSTPAHGTLQVVVRPPATSAGPGVFEDAEPHSGQILSSLRLISLDDGMERRWKLVWRVHHALFDEWTLPMVQQTVSGFYYDSKVPSLVQFKHFINYLESSDSDTSWGAHSTYWTDYLQDIVVTPEDVDPLLQSIDDDSTTSTYHTIPLCIEYSLSGENSMLQTIFDSNAISSVQMMRILQQIDHVAQQLQRLGPEATVDDIEYLSTSDKQELESWNEIRPEPVSDFIDHVIAREAARRAHAQADHDRLMPIGCVGELLIEGHLLAKGYLNNPEKTAEVFITNPVWADSSNSSTTRRFYKTGDLARYADDGTVVCLGRKDAQVNLNGYRIETGDVEANLRNLLDERVHDLAVEVVIPEKNNPTATPLLVAFLSMTVSSSGLQDTSSNIEDTPQAKLNLARVLREARLPERLHTVLPSYMVPTAFIPLTCMPQSIARKTDRGALQRLVSHLATQELRSFVEGSGDEGDDMESSPPPPPPPPSPPLTPTAALHASSRTKADPILLLQELFATVVGLGREYVNMDQSFIRLGGDSIHALRFVAAARRNGFTAMTVAETLRASTLQDLASLYDPESFELVSSPAQAPVESKTVLHSFVGVDIPSSEIEATQPATGFQRLAFEVSLLPQRGYMNSFSFTFHGSVHLHRLEHAIERVVARHGILRTVFVESQDPQAGLLQVVLRHRLSDKPRLVMIESDDVTSIMPDTGYGKPLVRFSLHQGPPTKLILCISHALYDAVGIDTLCHDLSIAYQGTPFACVPAPQFYTFVAAMPRRNESREFWKHLLRGSRKTEIREALCSSGSTTMKGVEDSEIKVRMRCPPPPSSGSARPRSHQYTFATYLKAAWALVLAHNSSGSSASDSTQKFDVVFGHGVTTRSIVPSSSTDLIVGPCLDIIPVRVTVPAATSDAPTAGALLHSIHSQHLSGLPHHAYGLSDIVRDCTNWLSGASSDAKASVNCISTVLAHHGIEERPPTIQLQNEVAAQGAVKARLFGGWDLWVVSTVLSESQDGSSEVEILMIYCADTLDEERVRMLLHALVAEVHRLRLFATL